MISRIRKKWITDGRTDGRTDAQIPPVFYRTSSPSGPLPKKAETDQRIWYILVCRFLLMMLLLLFRWMLVVRLMLMKLLQVLMCLHGYGGGRTFQRASLSRSLRWLCWRGGGGSYQGRRRARCWQTVDHGVRPRNTTATIGKVLMRLLRR